ncbi:MAG: hypothetical protein AB8B96_19380 [Lysobacterales bacterium]
MQAGPIVAAAVIIAYLGFELHTIGRNTYRTEKDFVYQQFVSAKQAVDQCGTGPRAQQQRFLRNMASTKGRALAAIQAQNPSQNDTAWQRSLTQLKSDAIAEVQQLVEEKGCQDMAVWQWLRRYENLAKLNLP